MHGRVRIACDVYNNNLIGDAKNDQKNESKDFQFNHVVLARSFCNVRFWPIADRYLCPIL